MFCKHLGRVLRANDTRKRILVFKKKLGKGGKMALVSESQNQTSHERMLNCRRDEGFVFRHPKQSRFFFGRLSQLEEVQAISEQQTIGRLVLVEKRRH